jgi:DNA-binding transcriptional MerR regulator
MAKSITKKNTVKQNTTEQNESTKLLGISIHDIAEQLVNTEIAEEARQAELSKIHDAFEAKFISSAAKMEELQTKVMDSISNNIENMSSNNKMRLLEIVNSGVVDRMSVERRLTPELQKQQGINLQINNSTNTINREEIATAKRQVAGSGEIVEVVDLLSKDLDKDLGEDTS